MMRACIAHLTKFPDTKQYKQHEKPMALVRVESTNVLTRAREGYLKGRKHLVENFWTIPWLLILRNERYRVSEKAEL